MYVNDEEIFQGTIWLFTSFSFLQKLQQVASYRVTIAMR